MFERIEKALGNAGVSLWSITKSHVRTAELYFIKKKLDLPRLNDILQYEVTVCRDAEEGGRKLRGQSVAYIVPGMTDEEIGRKIEDAYFAARFVKNPFYELPDKVTAPHCASPSDLKDLPLEDIAARFAEAALAADNEADAFLNSMEIFIYRRSFEIKASNGLHVSYDTDDVFGDEIQGSAFVDDFPFNDLLTLRAALRGFLTFVYIPTDGADEFFLHRCSVFNDIELVVLDG